VKIAPAQRSNAEAAQTVRGGEYMDGVILGNQKIPPFFAPMNF
jgi:hypothetical protein